MTVFTLKIIAIISMILDHIKYAIPSTNCFATMYLGRISFPIFAFLISEGFIHTHSRTKYMLRILFFAIISQIPFYLFSHYVAHSKIVFNVLFTFEMSLVGLYIVDYFYNKKNINSVTIKNVILITILLFFILAISFFIHPDYGWYGVLSVWIFYLCKNNKILTTLSFSCLNLLYYLSAGIESFKNRVSF